MFSANEIPQSFQKLGMGATSLQLTACVKSALGHFEVFFHKLSQLLTGLSAVLEDNV